MPPLAGAEGGVGWEGGAWRRLAPPLRRLNAWASAARTAEARTRPALKRPGGAVSTCRGDPRSQRGAAMPPRAAAEREMEGEQAGSAGPDCVTACWGRAVSKRCRWRRRPLQREAQSEDRAERARSAAARLNVPPATLLLQGTAQCGHTCV